MKRIFLSLFVLIIFCIFFNFKNQDAQNTVSFSSWGSQSETKLLEELLNEFEDKTNIKVDFIHIPQNYFQKIHLLFASNLEPDVVFINNHYLQMYSKAKLLEDLSPHINENDFYNVAIDCLKSEEKLYAIPRDISSLVLFVNKSIIKEEITKISTIFELKDIAKKYTTNNHWGINFEENPLYWSYFLASNGGGILSDTSKKIIINKEESIEALNLYSDLANKGKIAPTKSQIGSMTTAQMFINGKLAMYLGGRWMIPKFKETIEFDWDIIEFPTSGNNKVYIDSSGWAISKKAKNKENAIKLVKFLSSKKSIEKLAQSGLITPARKDVKQEYPIFITMLNNAKPTPTNKNYGKINDIITEKAKYVLSGDKKTEEVFDTKTIKEIESLL